MSRISTNLTSIWAQTVAKSQVASPGPGRGWAPSGGMSFPNGCVDELSDFSSFNTYTFPLKMVR